MNDAVLGIDPSETGIRFAVGTLVETEPLIVPDFHLRHSERSAIRPALPSGRSAMPLWPNTVSTKSDQSICLQRVYHATEMALALAAASRNLVCHTAVISACSGWSDEFRRQFSDVLSSAGLRRVRFFPDALCLCYAAGSAGRWLTYLSGASSFAAGAVSVDEQRNSEVHRIVSEDQPSLHSLQRDLMEAALARVLPLQQAAAAAKAAPSQLRIAGEIAILRLLRDQPLNVTFDNEGEELTIALDREFLEKAMDSAVNRGVRLTSDLQDETGLRNLSGILVHGAGAEIARPDRKLERQFGVRIVRGGPWDLACGAASLGIHSPDLAGSTADAGTERHPAQSVGTEVPGVKLTAGTLRVRLHRSLAASTKGESKERIESVPESGDRATSTTRDSEPVPDKTLKSVELALAMQAIRRARNLIEQKEYQAAVTMSHQARRDDSNSPQVLSAMIDVHIEAANANGTPKTYKASIEWLVCAINHDRGNRKTRQALADRHLLHSQQMLEAGNPGEALVAAKKAFQIRPDSPEMEAALDSAQEAIDRSADSP